MPWVAATSTASMPTGSMLASPSIMPAVPMMPRQVVARCAYVFILYGSNCEQYFLGVLTVAWALMKHLSVQHRVLMHTPDVPRHVLEQARAFDVFDEIVPTEYIEASEVFFSNPQAQRRFGQIFTKYRVLGLERYEKVLLLDADLHVRANIDSLFDLQPPAGMARGKKKFPEGEPMPPSTPINAGLMLLRPDAAHLSRIIEEITGPRPRRLGNYNSPDADFLTEVALNGQWTSIPLEFNYQLEFDRLEAAQGIIRFSAAREAHFSEAGAAMPWSMLKVCHFSGVKPWPYLLEDAAALQHLRAANSGTQSPLGDKLVEGIREYAREVSALQGLCSQMRLGEGTIWRETRLKQIVLPAPTDVVRGRLHALLPNGGRWFEGHRPQAVVWVPPGEGLPLPGAPVVRPTPVGAYLEVVERAALAVGSLVRAQVDGDSVQYAIHALSANRQMATLRRRVELSPQWQVVYTDNRSGCPYYHNKRTGQVQWQYPELPRDWQAINDDETDHVYYHNTRTNETLWPPPDFEELEMAVGELEPDLPLAGGDARWGAHSSATVWRRCFLDDPDLLQPMLKAVATVASVVV